MNMASNHSQPGPVTPAPAPAGHHPAKPEPLRSICSPGREFGAINVALSAGSATTRTGPK